MSLQIDFEKVAEVTGHANKGVARIMFKRMMAKIESDGQPTKTPTTPKSKKRKADDMADKGDRNSAKGKVKYYCSTSMLISLTVGNKNSRAKAAEVELGEESKDVKDKIKREGQPDAPESE